MVQAREQPGPQEMGPNFGDGGEMFLEEIFAVAGGHQGLGRGQPQPRPIDPQATLPLHQIIPVKDRWLSSSAAPRAPPPRHKPASHTGCRSPGRRRQSFGGRARDLGPCPPPKPPSQPLGGGEVGAKAPLLRLTLTGLGEGVWGRGQGLAAPGPLPQIFTAAGHRRRPPGACGCGNRAGWGGPLRWSGRARSGAPGGVWSNIWRKQKLWV